MRTGFGKITVVVDEDVDVWDDFAVDWALSWHVRPDRDVYVERDVQAVGLDPSQAPADVPQHHPSRHVGSRVAIDATRKHTYPAVSLPPKEHLDLVADRWRDYGIDERDSAGLRPTRTPVRLQNLCDSEIRLGEAQTLMPFRAWSSPPP